MGENQNPLNSLKRYKSSRHMTYESIMEQLGRKLIFQKNQAIDEAHHAEVQAEKAKKQLNKKVRITDTIDTVSLFRFY